MKKSRNSWKKTQTDGVIDSKLVYQASDDKIYHERGHNKVNRDSILNRNATIRREMPFTAKAMRENQLILTIPQGDLQFLQVEFPDLLSTVMDDKAQAYKAVAAAHPEYIQYKKQPGAHNHAR